MKSSIQLNKLLPGNLSKLNKKHGVFYHLTWKEDQKTRTKYIRLDEVKKVKAGVKACRQAKEIIEKAARSNLIHLLIERKSK